TAAPDHPKPVRPGSQTQGTLFTRLPRSSHGTRPFRKRQGISDQPPSDPPLPTTDSRLRDRLSLPGNGHEPDTPLSKDQKHQPPVHRRLHPDDPPEKSRADHDP